MDFFDKYTSNFDLTDFKLKYKYFHSIRVMDNMELLAKNMSLPPKDIELAKCIGLLHDIGRFEQYTRYGSFDDYKLDHGTYGMELLKKEQALKYFNIDKIDYEVVYKAIYNHNKYVIEDGLNHRELLFSKMIRDADKLDILYSLGNKELKKVFYDDDSAISQDVIEAFYKNKLIKKTKDSTRSDDKMILMSFAYDINYDISLSIIKENDYYNKIYKRLANKAKFKEYITYINNYINERVD